MENEETLSDFVEFLRFSLRITDLDRFPFHPSMNFQVGVSSGAGAISVGALEIQ